MAIEEFLAAALLPMNKASHGVAIEPSEVAETLKIGSEFLAELRKLIHS